MTLFKDTCPHCGQSMKGSMFGIYFTPGRYRILKEIFDNPGISLERLRAKLYPNGDPQGRVILSTITAINDRLEGSGLKIRGPKPYGQAGYRIIEDTRWGQMWEKPFHRPELL